MDSISSAVLYALVALLSVAVLVIIFLMIRNGIRIARGETPERVGSDIRNWYGRVRRRPLAGDARPQDGAYAPPGTPLEDIPDAYDENSNVPKDDETKR